MSVDEVRSQHDPDVAVTFAATLIDQWRSRGVRHVIVSPGSRSTPLVIGLQWVLDHQAPGEADPLEAHLVLDERSAAFQAVGVARATGAPALLVCTSGTAAVEYHPAVVEAHLAALPLLICTADRPPELQGTGAPQTIDQHRLFGTSVRAFLEPGPPRASAGGNWRALADEAFDGATGARPGPVHLNLAFREPLVGTVGRLPESSGVERTGAKPGPPDSDQLAGLIARTSGRRVAIVAGERSMAPGASPEAARSLLDSAEALGWPVLADPQSGLRLDHPAVVPNFDPMLRSQPVAEALRPDVVIRLGALVSSKVTNQWLATVPDQVAIDPAGWFPDPDRVVTTPIQAMPLRTIEALGDATSEGRLDPAPKGWADRWSQVSATVGRTLADARPEVVEAAALTAALDGLPAGAHLVVSSSMPVRDLEWFGPPVPAGVAVHANRGANGIDGVIATAVGIARTGSPTVVVVGDLALLHDVGSLVSAVATPNLVVVVVDNGGGGIFSFLSQHELLGEGDFERWWGTPSGLDLVTVAAGFGLEVADVDPADLAGAVRSALSGTAARGRTPMYRVESNRSDNLARHRRLLGRLADEAEGALDVTPETGT
ncbi:MAG: 2-succinyl-5-enolpyruvyl-6-hydroxy-3-cyclohexene-1-carboxylic-acid synthase [Microthrixaceae bacterium]|nr:2-succinyl-5-enolpyruvyl-6-hydroxy-3-cyclohexene-1-carboxylic-acid synthase [Microthrixaceae bacterium]